jgi:hypothetical protein
MPILEITYEGATRWAHPIRAAISGNPILVARDAAWRETKLSDLAFAVETRLSYLPQLITFIDDNIIDLHGELVAPLVKMHLREGASFRFQNTKVVRRLLFGTTAFITESRSCFESLAVFYCLFHQAYLDMVIAKPAAYEAVARSSGEDSWASHLRRIRGDLIHERSLFLAYDVDADETAWTPMFSMNWRPGHFGPDDRITMKMLVDIWEGLHRAASGIREEIINTATRRSNED